jgi:acetylornithine deacetylase/succinyl-diaminopimelate desuccinylase-like protein
LIDILVEEGSSRENIYAYIGKDRNPRYYEALNHIDSRTIVTSHIDVVPPHIPYSISGNTIRGRGSNDAKGSVATQIQAVEELRKTGKLGDGDIGLLYLVGEEVFLFLDLLTSGQWCWYEEGE